MFRNSPQVVDERAKCGPSLTDAPRCVQFALQASPFTSGDFVRQLSLAAVLLAACAGNRPAPASYPLRSAVAVDTAAGTVTLPLHRGSVGVRLVWYIVTESSDRADAARRGVSWSPRLAALAGTNAVQRASDLGDGIKYSAGVDFTPDRVVRPSPEKGFPPTEARPGSLAELGYSPFVQLPNGVIVNAPIIGDERRTLDRVVSLDVGRGRAALRITRGYANGRHAWYLSTEASDAMVAALEGATWTPNLASAPFAGTTAPGSARSAIVAIANGEIGADSPERQGMQSALLDGLSPLNILESAPDERSATPPYTPVWDLHLVMWTPAAIAAGQRAKVITLAEVRAFAERGLLVSAMPGAPNALLAGLHAVGVVINCPVVATFARN